MPTGARTHRLDEQLAGKSQTRSSCAELRIRIFDVGGARLAERQTVAGKAERLQGAFEDGERAFVFRRHAGTPDQLARQLDGIEGAGHAIQLLSSSLIDVLARVPASTRFRITAQ